MAEMRRAAMSISAAFDDVFPRRMPDLWRPSAHFGFVAGGATDVMAAGEGLETMLTLRMFLPEMLMIAKLSAAHLSAIALPGVLRRLYIAADSDGAGRAGTERLSTRAREAGIEVLTLRPVLGDFNDDLRRSGTDSLRLSLLQQLAPGDAARLLI